MFLVYRILTTIFFPLLILVIYFRKIINKEDGKRFKEKFFINIDNLEKIDRDKKKLIWFHAASIGEINSIKPLLKELEDYNKNLIFLLTTVTISSGRIVEKELVNNKNIFHQYFPLDIFHVSNNFLRKWKPDIAIFVDSEIWPNFIFQIKKRNIPLILLNARITKKTFKKWRILKNFSKKIFSCFDLCLSSSKESQNNLSQLGAKKILFYGNLKFSVQDKSLKIKKENKEIFDKKKVWLASSTHEGEELISIKTHILLKKNYNNILTIIAPRHISRVKKISYLVEKMNLNCQILNDKDLINKNAEIILINSFGVLNKYFDYCKSVFIGKSLIKKLISEGGQNPIEAVRQGCKIYHGPFVYNFDEVYKFLESNNLSKKIHNSNELFLEVNNDFKNNYEKKGSNLIQEYGRDILSKTVKEITQLIK